MQIDYAKLTGPRACAACACCLARVASTDCQVLAMTPSNKAAAMARPAEKTSLLRRNAF